METDSKHLEERSDRTKMLNRCLTVTEVIDWQHPCVLDLARALAGNRSDPFEIARRSFEWVRDEIRHSWDYHLNPVTCSASEVLEHGTGLCYAKSHLLAAVLRANGIPAGFCYQRLSRDEPGAPFCLHGLNCVYLPGNGWYKIDARGNKPGVDAQFEPPEKRLAFAIQFPGEYSLPELLSAPRHDVIAALRQFSDINELWEHLPDCETGARP